MHLAVQLQRREFPIEALVEIGRGRKRIQSRAQRPGVGDPTRRRLQRRVRKLAESLVDPQLYTHIRIGGEMTVEIADKIVELHAHAGIQARIDSV